MKTFLTRYRSIGAPLFLTAVLTATAQPAAAAGFTDFLNNILEEFESAKQPIALIALMFIGAGWLFNFVDLRRAAWAIGGVVLIYASSEVLSMITG
ncbi:Type IV secretion system protein virB2 precursor (plasmid) [Phaeobacter piscinae]|uniref:Type IV secretion system protein virB2 n=1 Tax=Phaeobacter piscinae TaxID=1580596 RepID=A0ABN5DK67_9RHOB|nr:TrbC/VirB2 family protein [Phaeobacter piscinae]ATG37832.1 Type IV secretion system protein virB2 precursor [Phaeobacter piscinae]AUQ88353.1 Type IV secretion system protein virB2 precursor [Phaeobacter piscinae]AUR26236.1 Type IV secretion system protein virB2 precursor [Phaeobacter piscinae]